MLRGSIAISSLVGMRIALVLGGRSSGSGGLLRVRQPLSASTGSTKRKTPRRKVSHQSMLDQNMPTK